MQTKHTFLFASLLSLVWMGILFANSAGPNPASNGINGPTCSQNGCHVGNVVNASGGTLTLTGLPADWTPGETYTLTVSMQRSGSPRQGFQLSAVNAANQQAGSFSLVANTGRIAVPVSAGIQYAQHSVIATTNGIFTINWTAPASADAGTVRFNLAANASNGNGALTGDFIYTKVETRDPAAPVNNSIHPYEVVNLGGSSSVTDGQATLPGGLDVGHARIIPSSGGSPAGVAIFGFRTNNILVTEAGVPASPLVTSGRIYAEVAGPVNTGLAISNPNPGAATFSFTFTNAAGVDTSQGMATIPAFGQIAAFLDQAPFNGGAAVQGTFTFSSTAPVGVIALRGLTNERGEFLITTLPVVSTASTPTGAVFLPHFADGGGWTTSVVLVNAGDTPMTGNLEFFGQGSGSVAAAPVQVGIGGQIANSFPYTVPPRSSQRLVTSGAGSSTASGSIRIVPTDGGDVPASLAIFSFRQSGVTVTEAGVPGIRGTEFRMYVESSGTPGQPGNIQTGIALTNTSSAVASVNLELTRLDGTAVGLTAPVDIAPGGQTAKFLAELFPTLPQPFQGILRITSGADISVVGLRGRYNERSDFLITTTPPSLESLIQPVTELSFPHVVNGGGYTTQFVLFNGTAGQAGSGELQFLTQGGAAFNLTPN